MTPSDMPTDPSIDAALTRLEAMGGESFMREMIRLFLSFVAAKAGDGRLAAKQRNYLGVEKAFHAIKSSAANIGAQRLRDLAEELEQLAREQAPEPLLPKVQALEEEFERVQGYLRNKEWSVEDGNR